MFPALPTGRQCTSGASPSSSTISNAAVFWPCSRSGLTELTRATGYSAASFLASSRQSSNEPSTCSSLARSEEHTSELQSRLHLVCRLLLEKKKNLKT